MAQRWQKVREVLIREAQQNIAGDDFHVEDLRIVIEAIKDGYRLCKVVNVISDASDYAPGMKVAIIMEE